MNGLLNIKDIACLADKFAKQTINKQLGIKPMLWNINDQ